MKQRNAFISGIIGDLDKSFIKPDSWVFPTLNVRIFNKDGRGYTITSQLGNEVLFDAGDKYIIAAEEHNGIVYIVSIYDNTGETLTEIGSYPAPLVYTDTGGTGGGDPGKRPNQFTNKYLPLKNYRVAGQAKQFITEKFKYTKESNLKLIIDDAFDESANLYLCDGVNTDKVVNSGFTRNGDRNDITYSEIDFDGKMNHILYSLKPPVTDSIDVVVGGILRPGQYHFYYSYRTSTYDSTEYLTGSYGIHVGEGSTISDIAGMLDKNAEGRPNKTNKKIVIKLSNLDSGYSYLSVGILRMFNDDINGLQLEEYALAKEFNIENEKATIEITGRENTQLFSEDELYTRYLKERVSTDHIFYNSRIFKANLSRKGYDPKPFTALALKVTCSTKLGDKVQTPYYRYIVSGDNVKPMFYQDPENINNKLGYFDGEIYPFSVVFFLKDGTKTAAYPITGNNEGKFLASEDPSENKKGLVWVNHTNRLTDADPLRWTLKLEMNIESMIHEIRSNSDFENVEGFYITRGERLKNLLYDGYFTRTANGLYFMKDREHHDDDFSNTTSCYGKGAGDRGKVDYKNPTKVWFGDVISEGDALCMPVFKDLEAVRKGVDYLGVGNEDWWNLYYFPIGVMNDNYPKTKLNIISDMPDEFEYTRAYKYPWRKVRYPDYGKDSAIFREFSDNIAHANIVFEDDVDAMLNLSKDHFAIISPDFSMEMEHSFSSGEDLTVHFYTKPRANKVWRGEGVRTYTTAVSLRAELIPIGASTQIDPLKRSWCFDIPEAQVWKAGEYFAQHITGATYLLPFTDDMLEASFVKASDAVGALTYVCIKNTVKTPTAQPGVDPDYWKEIIGSGVYGQEQSSYDFPGNSGFDKLIQKYIRPGCTPNSYPIPGGGTTHSKIPNWETSTVYAGFKSTQIPSQYLESGHGNISYGHGKTFTQTRDVYFDKGTDHWAKISCYPVSKGTHMAVGRFSSYAEDGYNYKGLGKKGLFYTEGDFWMTTKGGLVGIGAEAKMKMAHYNRSYQTPGYIGLSVETDGSGDPVDSFFSNLNDLDEYMAKVYKEDPNGDTFFQAKLDAFNSEYTQYWNVSNYIPVTTNLRKLDIYKGDNYKSAVWLRMNHHVDFDENESKKTTGFHSWGRDDINLVPKQYSCILRSSMFSEQEYTHGYLHGILTSNAHNVNFRSDIKSINDKGKEIVHSFFPKVASDVEPSSWVRSSASDADSTESYLIPAGNDANYGNVKVLGYDKRTPTDSYNKSTRIAFSNKRIAESFANGYRIIGMKDFRDFSTNYGHIKRIAHLSDKLFSVREKAIAVHYVGQTELSTEGEQVTMSPVSIYLSDQEPILSYYGIQDFHALMKTKSAIYGIDVLSRELFLIGMSYGKSGTTARPSVQILSKQFMIENVVDEIISNMADKRISPVILNGVTLGFNEDYSEIYFTFLNKQYKSTLVYNEQLGFFTGNSNISASLYSSFRKGLLSVQGDVLNGDGLFYQNDIKTSSLISYYGIEGMSELSFVVNGVSEEENTSVYTKIFEAIEIISNKYPLTAITYETDQQTTESPFTVNSAEFWKDAEWIEEGWFIPVIKQAHSGDYYDTDSVIRGKWMKVTLKFKADERFQITSILSKFNISYS